MNMLLLFIIIATIVSGLFGGINLQKLIVELPARKKVGAVTFAKYARASDLGNGLFIYPAFAIIGELITISSFLIALSGSLASEITVLLGLASGAGFGVLAMTFFAAPQMLSIGKAEDKEEVLSQLLEKIVLYSWPRAVFVWLQFGLLLWAFYLV